MTAVSELTSPTERIRRPKPASPFVEGIYRAASLIGSLIVWEILVRLLNLPAYFIPAPSDVGMALIRGADLYASHYLITLYRTVTAFFVALIAGVALGTLISEIKLFSRIIYPILVSFQSMPKIALAPIVIVWFGFGSMSKIILGAFSAFFPIYLNTLHGLKGIDAEQITLMRSLGASRWQTFWKVKFPNALPFLLAGANIGIIYATLAVIVGEFVGANNGMGFLIINQSNQLDTPGVFANILILSATGLFFHYSIQYLRSKAIFW